PFRDLADIERLERRPYDEVVPVRTILELLQRAACTWGDRPALSFVAGGDPEVPARVVGFAALLAQSLRAANLYRSLGVPPDASVAILAPNMPETQYALWGAEIACRA